MLKILSTTETINLENLKSLQELSPFIKPSPNSQNMISLEDFGKQLTQLMELI